MEERILTILEDICRDPVVREDPDIDLMEEGLMDSLDYVNFLIDIEDEFGIIIAPTEVTREEVATPAKIIQVVLSRLDEMEE
ncbi:MAG: D-alanine--poly(phosphoribitol) ligase subunit DltC [Firmicutes bacterium]|nr:D-alanine--poly(phosphoribitol) ligase subunit DltC [Bacillota bacterium]